MTKPSTTALDPMHQTLQSYEGSAREYDKLVDPHRPPHIQKALRRLVEVLPPGGRVLEIGLEAGSRRPCEDPPGVRAGNSGRSASRSYAGPLEPASLPCFPPATRGVVIQLRRR